MPSIEILTKINEISYLVIIMNEIRDDSVGLGLGRHIFFGGLADLLGFVYHD